MALERTSRRDLRVTDAGLLLCAALMLGVALIAIKTYHLGVPPRDGLSDYVRSLSAISYADALFATACWAVARLVFTEYLKFLAVWVRTRFESDPERSSVANIISGSK